VYVDAPPAVHATIGALAGIVHLTADVSDDSEASPEALLSKLRGKRFDTLTPARRIALRLIARQLATRADGTGTDGDAVPEIATMEDWLDVIIQRMQKSDVRLRDFIVRT